MTPSRSCLHSGHTALIPGEVVITHLASSILGIVQVALAILLIAGKISLPVVAYVNLSLLAPTVILLPKFLSSSGLSTCEKIFIVFSIAVHTAINILALKGLLSSVQLGSIHIGFSLGTGLLMQIIGYSDKSALPLLACNF